MKKKILPLLTLFIFFSSSVFAGDAKFVGTWEGIPGHDLYTKLILHEDSSVTYCDVQSCRQINCWKMDYQGSTDGKFSYQNLSGTWEFERLNEEEISGKYTNPEGGGAVVLYEPQ